MNVSSISSSYYELPKIFEDNFDDNNDDDDDHAVAHDESFLNANVDETYTDGAHPNEVKQD